MTGVTKAPRPVREARIEERPGPLHPDLAAKSRSRWRAFVALTKPRVIRLLLVTTVPSMILAAGGWPGWWLVVITVGAGALAAGSANAFNMVYDRDIDAVMQRTGDRPLVTGELRPREALVFASVLGAASVAVFAVLVNVLSAVLTALAIGLYVVLYTMVLKRRTDQNIVWGGSAGAMPVLIGWAAVTDALALAPVLLFLVVFLWTPAHYWPLALVYKDDYAEADVPMSSVTRSSVSVAWHSLAYAAALAILALALTPAAGLGMFYLVVAAVSSAGFLWCAVRLVAAARAGTGVQRAAMVTFRASIVFLTLVFAAVAVDPFL